MNQLKLLLMSYLLIMVSMLLQFQFIWPAEAVLLSNWSEGPASLLFLPHGVKALLIVLFGPVVSIAIALAHLSTDLLVGVEGERLLFSFSVSTLVLLIPMLMFNYVSQRPLLSGVLGSDKGLVSYAQVSRLVFSVALIAALMNALLNAAWYSESGVSLLAFRYILGDILGALTTLVVWLIGSKWLLKGR